MELAERVGVPVDRMREILEESRAMGIVEPTSRGWRLTPAAAKDLGPALRDLSLPSHDLSRPAPHRDVLERRAA
jgi:hypothetical protein